MGNSVFVRYGLLQWEFYVKKLYCVNNICKKLDYKWYERKQIAVDLYVVHFQQQGYQILSSPRRALDTNGAYWMTTFWHILVSC